MSFQNKDIFEGKMTINWKWEFCVILFSGLLIACPSFLSIIGTNVVVIAEEISSEKNQEIVTLTTYPKDGVTIVASATPGRLSFDIKGDIKEGDYFPLLFIPNEKKSKDLTEKQKRAKEAALQLISTSGTFVSPRKIKTNLTKVGKIKVVFKFLGEEDNNRRIKLISNFKNNKGEIIDVIERECFDGRIVAKREDRFTVISGFLALKSILNSQNIRFKRELKGQVSGVEIIFEEIFYIDGNLW